DFIKWSMNSTSVFSIPNKACISASDFRIVLVRNYNETESSTRWKHLYLIWISVPGSLWISPSKLGAVVHATRLGCFGYDEAIEEYRSREQVNLDLLKKIGKNKLAQTSSFQKPL